MIYFFSSFACTEKLSKCYSPPPSPKETKLLRNCVAVCFFFFFFEDTNLLCGNVASNYRGILKGHLRSFLGKVNNGCRYLITMIIHLQF